MKKADIVSAVVLIAFGLVLLFVIIPGWVPRHEEGGYGLGAQVMPRVWATLVTVLSAGLLFARLAGRGRHGTAELEDDVRPPITRANGLFLLWSSLFLIAMTALFEWVGFLAAGPLTIAGFMISMGERRPVPVALTSVGAAGAIWLFFWQLLNFPLP